MKYLKNRYVQLALALILGIGAGSLLKDTKTIETKIRKEVSEKHQKEISRISDIHRGEIRQLSTKLKKEETSHKSFKEESNRKVHKLTTENYSLRQKVKKRRYKIVKPDGTIIEKEYEDSETQETSTVVTEIKEEFTRKVASIESKWKKIHKSRVSSIKKTYDEKITKLEKELKEKKSTEEEETKVTINEKKLRTEVGMTFDKEYYGHMSYTIWGPLIIGLHATESTFGAGIGLEL